MPAPYRLREQDFGGGNAGYYGGGDGGVALAGAAAGAGQDQRRGKEAIGGRCGRVEWRFVQRRARGTACRHGRGGTGGSNNRVVRTLYPGGTEMADNGDGAEDDAAAMEETREMGNNGEGKRMAAIIGGRGEEE